MVVVGERGEGGRGSGSWRKRDRQAEKGDGVKGWIRVISINFVRVRFLVGGSTSLYYVTPSSSHEIPAWVELRILIIISVYRCIIRIYWSLLRHWDLPGHRDYHKKVYSYCVHTCTFV